MKKIKNTRASSPLWKWSSKPKGFNKMNIANSVISYRELVSS